MRGCSHGPGASDAHQRDPMPATWRGSREEARRAEGMVAAWARSSRERKRGRDGGAWPLEGARHGSRFPSNEAYEPPRTCAREAVGNGRGRRSDRAKGAEGRLSFIQATRSEPRGASPRSFRTASERPGDPNELDRAQRRSRLEEKQRPTEKWIREGEGVPDVRAPRGGESGSAWWRSGPRRRDRKLGRKGENRPRQAQYHFFFSFFFIFFSFHF
jgi:hypothetical protein